MRNEFTFRQMTQNSRAWSPEFRRDAAEEAARCRASTRASIDGELRDTTIAAINAYINRKR